MADTQRGYFRQGRARSVKPEVFLHEGLFDLEMESGLPIRLCWMGLWTQCDREGRFRWRPRALKAALMPYDDLDFSKVLACLRQAGFIVPYEVDGDLYAYIPTWKKHQFINNREQVSDIPAPNKQHIDSAEKQAHLFTSNGMRLSRDGDASSTRETHVASASPARGARDGDGKTASRERGDRDREEKDLKAGAHAPAVVEDAAGLWNKVKVELKSRMDASTYDRTFRNTWSDGARNGTLYVTYEDAKERDLAVMWRFSRDIKLYLKKLGYTLAPQFVREGAEWKAAK